MNGGNQGVSIVQEDSGRNYSLLTIVVICVGAILFVGVLLSLVSSASGIESPAESLVPTLGAQSSTISTGGFGSGIGFGALNVDSTQLVGGQTAAESENSFRTLDTEVHFEVTGSEASYWRSGAFDVYKGVSWFRSESDPPPTPSDGKQLEYRVNLSQPARSLPVVWRPIDVKRPQSISVSDRGMVIAPKGLPAGGSYVVQSNKHDIDPDSLQNANATMPEGHQRRYTSLPNKTRDALRPVTANITNGSDTPYESITRIESWLEETKNYTLEPETKKGEDIAVQFVTEMDAGYCEYFATAMVAMLRAEDIPSRYVVGYSTGQRIDSNTFRVRAMNAHAWVEVYFSEIGWVRFDPTPGGPRLRAERIAFQQSNASGTYHRFEAGSPGETFTGFSSNDSNYDRGFAETPPGFIGPRLPGSNDDTSPWFSLNRTPVAGAPIEITYEHNSSPVVGANMSINGVFVGQTDSEGNVSTRIPYSTRLNVTVIGGHTGVTSTATPTGTWTSDRDGNETILASENLTNVTRSESYFVQTNATISFIGGRVRNAPVQLRATINKVPVQNASVRINETQIGYTDNTGQVEVTLPISGGPHTLSVEKGPINETMVVGPGDLEMTVSPVWPIPIAGTKSVLTLQVGGDPVANALVEIDGEPVGRTDRNGQIISNIPLQSTVAVSVSVNDRTISQTISNPLLNTFAIGTILSLLVVLGLLRRRVKIVLDPYIDLNLRNIYLKSILIGRSMASFPGATVSHIRQTMQLLAEIIRGEETVSGALVAFTNWLFSRKDGLSEDNPSIQSPSISPSSDLNQATTEDIHDEELPVLTAWRRFLHYVSISDIETKTPGQIATHAISADGLAEDAVETLLDEFRAVFYGPRTADETAPKIQEALEQIEQSPAVSSDVRGRVNTDRKSESADRSVGGRTNPTEQSNIIPDSDQ